MSDLFGNHIVGFPTRWLISLIISIPLSARYNDEILSREWLNLDDHCFLLICCTQIHVFLVIFLFYVQTKYKSFGSSKKQSKNVYV